jgi:YfiH family protein
MVPEEFLTIPQFNCIPFLRHGFGNAHWKEKDFARREGWRDFSLVWLDQVHSEIVHFIRKVPDKSLRGDALVTDLPRIFLIIKTADCLPILLVDQAGRAIAAVHCGWKGTLDRVVEKVVLGMKEHYGSDPGELLAAFGPCIGKDCYEVGDDVRGSYAARGFPEALFRPLPGRRRKFLLDLQEANRLQLLQLGFRAGHIFSVDVCTHCHSSFLSYRRDKSRAGRMLSFIGMTAQHRY